MRTIVQRAPSAPRGLLAAVGVGVAFGLGTLVSGGDAHAVDVDRGDRGNALVVAAQRGDAFEATRAKLKLSYGNELAKADPPEPKRAPAKPAIAKAAATAANAKPAAAIPEEAAAPIEAPPTPIAEDRIEARAEDRVKADDDASVEDVEKRSGDDLKAAIARVVAQPLTDVLAEAKPAEPHFSLQVAAAPTQAGADDVARKLGAQGHAARVVEGQVGGKPVFRVRVGAFADRTTADAYKAKLTMPAFIVAAQ